MKANEDEATPVDTDDELVYIVNRTILKLQFTSGVVVDCHDPRDKRASGPCGFPIEYSSKLAVTVDEIHVIQ